MVSSKSSEDVMMIAVKIGSGGVLAGRALNLAHSRCCLAAWETARRAKGQSHITT